MSASGPRVICVASKGRGSNDEARIVALLAPLSPTVWAFDHSHKTRSFLAMLLRVPQLRPDVVVLEGTGIAGGCAVMLLRVLARIPFILSSGDAVAPYLRAVHPWTAPVAMMYEWLLCRLSAGYVGWTPYLSGRALTLGAPRAICAPGFAFFHAASGDREQVRREHGIPPQAIVFGLVGTLSWYDAAQYCYGLELVRAAAQTRREDMWVMIVGDGNGRPHLEEILRAEGVPNVILIGRVLPHEVPRYLQAFDVASLPQSVDGIGAFRYTTKLSEYVSADLPVVVNQIPAAYDLDDGWFWRLPGQAPWDERYLTALSKLMATVTVADVHRRRERVSRARPLFEREPQVRRVSAFVCDVVAATANGRLGSDRGG